MPSVFCVPQRIYVVKNRLHRPEASPERRGEPPNGGGGVCRTHGRGFRTLRRAGMLPLRAAGAQEGRQPAVFHPLVNHPFSRKGLGADGRLRKHEKGERQSGYRSVGQTNVSAHFFTYTQCQIPFCYTYGLVYAGAAYPCRATFLPVQIIQILRLQPVCAGKRVARHCYAARSGNPRRSLRQNASPGSGEPPARFGCPEKPVPKPLSRSKLRQLPFQGSLQPSGGRKPLRLLFICRYINRCKFSENRVE